MNREYIFDEIDIITCFLMEYSNCNTVTFFEKKWKNKRIVNG